MDATLAISREAYVLSFDDFYAAEFDRIYRGALAIARDSDTAWDATQEAFGRAFARWASLRDVVWAPAWVMTTALNVCRSRRRRLFREVLGPTGDRAEVQGPDPVAVDLRAALQQVPRRQREALVLFYIGDFALTDVAAAMDIADGTAKALLAQGRDSLRRLMEVDQ